MQEYTAEEEVRAAHNVLEACAQTETMEKVVFTSSATAIVWRDSSSSPSPSPSHHDIDERNWSDINFCKKFKVFFFYYIPHQETLPLYVINNFTCIECATIASIKNRVKLSTSTGAHSGGTLMCCHTLVNELSPLLLLTNAQVSDHCVPSLIQRG